jgi:glycosyltransferase involved in cell wall biosynthesis
LWAGRLDREKRTDVLAAVAERMRDAPLHFHVFGSATLDSTGAYERVLRGLANVTLHGPFDGFESIPHGDFDAFLYTSGWDGLPNVLLAAAAAGLPIVAPDVGGVGEFISEQTGFLVSAPDAVDEYVAALEAIHAKRQDVRARAEAAQTLLSTRHSRESFRRALSTIPGYLSLAAQYSSPA